MSFFLIDFEECRAHARSVAALESECHRLAALLRDGGQPVLASQAAELAERMRPLSEAILEATALKERMDMQTLREVGGLDEKEGR